jgi:23S rRNA G2069 N7-methylase RlmK/C1962 C5-methylase RlmI
VDPRGLRWPRPRPRARSRRAARGYKEIEAILADAAVDAPVTIVEKRRQTRDHPVVLGVPETHYLKCFVLRKLE